MYRDDGALDLAGMVDAERHLSSLAGYICQLKSGESYLFSGAVSSNGCDLYGQRVESMRDLQLSFPLYLWPEGSDFADQLFVHAARRTVSREEYGGGGIQILACSASTAQALNVDAEFLETGYRVVGAELQLCPLEFWYGSASAPSIYIPPQIKPTSKHQFQKIFERLVVAAQRSAGKTLKTSKNKKKRRHTNLPCFPTELLFAAHAQGLLTIKATKNKLSVTTKWAELVEDQSVFTARYTGSKRSFQLGPNQQLQLFWDTLRLNASADLETDVVTDSDGNIVVSKLHTEKGHQALNLPRPKRTELGQFK